MASTHQHLLNISNEIGILDGETSANFKATTEAKEQRAVYHANMKDQESELKDIQNALGLGKPAPSRLPKPTVTLKRKDSGGDAAKEPLKPRKKIKKSEITAPTPMPGKGIPSSPYELTSYSDSGTGHIELMSLPTSSRFVLLQTSLAQRQILRTMAATRTKPSLFPSRRKEAPKALTLCTSSSSTADIVRSSLAMDMAQNEYSLLLHTRHEEAIVRRDASLKERLKEEAETKRVAEQYDENLRLIAKLHGDLRKLVGDAAYNNLLQSRETKTKQKPALPANMKGVLGPAIREYIQHTVDVAGEAGGSGGQIRRTRSTNKKLKVCGGGGEGDAVPVPSEIGTS
ncbi:hypothetical protein DFH06DRAFT_1429986 [Mycena polygramma]|nr:hypothetical protein DFH06DRAFT_1429986 [Mycena polygramma]